MTCNGKAEAISTAGIQLRPTASRALSIPIHAATKGEAVNVRRR
jgi:hypothetical protein